MADKKGSTSRQRRATGGFSLRPCTTTEQHMSAATGGKGDLSLRPCTTTKHHILVEDAPEDEVTGGEVPLKACPAKRKSAGVCEALNMFPAQAAASSGQRRAVDWAGRPTMAVDLVEDEAELRRRIKATLLTFPESKALPAQQLEVAIDRIVEESKPEAASVAAPGMVRMSDFDIRFFLSLPMVPTVDEILGADAGGVFPLGWIHERKKFLDEHCQVKNRKDGDKVGLMDKIRVDLLTRGYVEVQKEYVELGSDDEEDSDDDDCPYEPYDENNPGGVVLLI
ncbi:hypothetical protein CFC21_008077 [Triticum aestivum]|uniref:Uncharacterized protein n=2 Tax=Triticum aestivum TaxID=4565 RepID=A0A9R1ISG3_WHEAT|nr:hypothetical protein CFC21_008077 [Triticum aestivum]